MASLDVKTASDVARPSVVSRILSLTGVHGHVAKALLAEMQDVRGSACFENRSSGIRGASAKAVWRLPCFGDVWPNMSCGKPKKSGKPKDGDLPIGGENHSEYVLWVLQLWVIL